MKKFVLFLAVFVLIFNGCAHNHLYGDEEMVEESRSKPDWTANPTPCKKDRCFAAGVSEKMELQVMALASGEAEARRVIASSITEAVNGILKESIYREHAGEVDDLGWIYGYVKETATSLNISALREDYYLARYKIYESDRVKYYWRSWVLVSVTKAEIARAKKRLEDALNGELRKKNIAGAKSLINEIDKKFTYQGLPIRE